MTTTTMTITRYDTAIAGDNDGNHWMDEGSSDDDKDTLCVMTL